MREGVGERREPFLPVAETSASSEPQPWSVFCPPSRPSGPSSSVPMGTSAGPRGPWPFATVSLDPRRESESRGMGSDEIFGPSIVEALGCEIGRASCRERVSSPV